MISYKAIREEGKVRQPVTYVRNFSKAILNLEANKLEEGRGLKLKP